jgi:cell division protein FtsB
MEYEYLVKLKSHPTWRLLNAGTAPFIISFFYLVFIKPNRRAIPAGELIAKLDDYLYHLRKIHGDWLFPRTPKHYLETWASGEQAFLRKYYPEKGDEPEYDLTPASEKVIEWLSSLEQKRFVGTESRLLTIFRLLRDIATESSTDPQEQIQTLEKKKAAIEAEISRLKQGQMRPFDKTRIREQYLQAEETARSLLFDFRQIEENFRQLDRKIRQQIATSELPKGKLLDEIFDQQDVIKGSDQGRSFRAFWSYLMSPASQKELDRLLERVLSVADIKAFVPEEELKFIRFRLLEAGEKVNTTCALIMEQLRKYLDDQAWLENRRIISIIRKIEKTAVIIRKKAPDQRDFTTLANLKPKIELPLERGLFYPPHRLVVDDQPQEGKAEFDAGALFQQNHVDEQLLRDRIRKALRGRSQISLEQLCEIYPVEKGLSEVVAYLNLACQDDRALVDTDGYQVICWSSADSKMRKVHLPNVIFIN